MKPKEDTAIYLHVVNIKTKKDYKQQINMQQKASQTSAEQW